MTKEVWKNCDGILYWYKVSNIWRVIWPSGRIIKFWIDKQWYYKSYIRWKNIRLHRIMAEAFLWKNDGFCVNHKNWIKTDNNINNLERCTYSENNKHAYDIWKRTVTDKQMDCVNRKKIYVKDIYWWLFTIPSMLGFMRKFNAGYHTCRRYIKTWKLFRWIYLLQDSPFKETI